MKKIVRLIFFSLSLCFITCFPSPKSLEPPKEEMPISRVYPYDFDHVWNSILRTIVDYPFTLIEKESGIINTDWLGKTVKRKIKIWRGLIGGGYVEDEVPVELQERLNILVTKGTDSTSVKIIRYVKIRPYKMKIGGAGNWEPDVMSSFTQTYSDTQTEYRLLNEIENNILK